MTIQGESDVTCQKEKPTCCGHTQGLPAGSKGTCDTQASSLASYFCLALYNLAPSIEWGPSDANAGPLSGHVVGHNVGNDHDTGSRASTAKSFFSGGAR